MEMELNPYLVPDKIFPKYGTMLECSIILDYFKGRNFRGQKLSRGSKIAKFREFKFREFHVMKKIHGKNFRDFWKPSSLDGNNFRENRLKSRKSRKFLPAKVSAFNVFVD